MFGPSGAIRTLGPVNPNHVRYQLRYTRIFSFELLYHGQGENQSFSSLWSFMWSNPFFVPVLPEGKILQVLVSQRVPPFCFWEPGIRRLCSQMWRPTNWATPGYFAVMIIARNSCNSKFFPVCGQLCGQSGFSGRFADPAKSRKRPCCKAFRALAVPIVDRRRIAPKPPMLPSAPDELVLIRLGVYTIILPTTAGPVTCFLLGHGAPT